MKKEAIFFTCCDDANFKYAIPFWKSMTKFHSPKEIDMIIYTTMKDPKELAKLPEGIKVVDLTRYLKDPMFFYRQKPILSEPLLDEYELVVGLDCDQLVLGDLNYILNTKDYDVGTVINWNRADPQVFGFVELSRIGITPPEYFNCGLVALRSKAFAHNWLVNCFSPQFDRCQYKEQDILNIMCYFGNWNVRCFDQGDGVAKYYAWHGLIGKGEWNRAEIQGEDIVIPRGFGDTPFPPEDMKIKIVHAGGGAGAPKDNWGLFFNEQVMERINEITK